MQAEENRVEEQNNLEIIHNYLKQFSSKSTDLKDNISSIREYVYSNVIALLINLSLFQAKLKIKK